MLGQKGLTKEMTETVVTTQRSRHLPIIGEEQYQNDGMANLVLI
jgi:hypothetical protein